MSTRRGLSLADLLWCIAFLAQLMAAVLGPANHRVTLAIFVLTIILWAIEYQTLKSETDDKPDTKDVVFVGSILTAFALIDLFGVAAFWISGRFDLAIWTGSAAGFGLAGAFASARRPPRDFVMLSQLLFHNVAMLTVLSFPAAFFLMRLSNSTGALDALDLADRVVLLAWVLLPFSAFSILLALMVEIWALHPQPTRLWKILLVGQVCWSIHLVRATSALL